MRKSMIWIALVALAATASPAAAEDYSDHRAVLAIAETITVPWSDEPGGIFALQHDLGNGQLSHDFVYGDPRRAVFNGGEAGITFAVKSENTQCLLQQEQMQTL